MWSLEQVDRNYWYICYREFAKFVATTRDCHKKIYKIFVKRNWFYTKVIQNFPMLYFFVTNIQHGNTSSRFDWWLFLKIQGKKQGNILNVKLGTSRLQIDTYVIGSLPNLLQLLESATKRATKYLSKETDSIPGLSKICLCYIVLYPTPRSFLL
jgi:hypothetical protein